MLLGLTALVALPAAADPVYDMCLKPGQYGPEQCDCVAEALRSEFPAADFALYSSIARRYLDRLDQGLAQAEAWDAAVQSEALARQANYAGLLGTTNALARRHREITARCGG